jgi:hypothetical protein
MVGFPANWRPFDQEIESRPYHRILPRWIRWGHRAIYSRFDQGSDGIGALERDWLVNGACPTGSDYRTRRKDPAAAGPRDAGRCRTARANASRASIAP